MCLIYAHLQRHPIMVMTLRRKISDAARSLIAICVVAGRGGGGGGASVG